MVGNYPVGFFRGDSAELFAEFVVGRLAFATRVPRQQDIGHDLACFLRERLDARTFVAGAGFSVQVKSRGTPIEYDTASKTDWLKDQETPLFVAVADLAQLRVDIHWTRPALDVLLYRPAPYVELIPRCPSDNAWSITEWRDGREQGEALSHRVFLGDPILRVEARDVVDDARAEHLVAVLRSWLVVEGFNLVNTRAGIYWTGRPPVYVTNEPLAAGEYDVNLITNDANIPRCTENLVRSAISLIKIEIDAGRWLAPRTAADVRRRSALEDTVRKFVPVMDPVSRRLLQGIAPDLLE